MTSTTITLNDGKKVFVQAIFNTLRSARSAVEGARQCGLSRFIIQGDAPYFWVVCGRDAQRLEKAGYELVG